MIRLARPTRTRVMAAVVVAAVLVLGALLWFDAPRAQGHPAASGLAADPGSQTSLRDRGRELFTNNCSSCHGVRGEGTDFGPSLTDAGAAAADFMLRTGRMPLADPNEQAVRKPPAFTPDEIKALDAYVGSLGNGPEIPQFTLRGASLSDGEELFTVNCAPCHGITGSGDAIGGPAFAPSLSQASALDVHEAVLIGPGQMPKFGLLLDPQEINDISKYVAYIRNQPNPGGADLGYIGPVPEGFVAWFLGAGLIVVITILFVARGSHGSETEEEGSEH